MTYLELQRDRIAHGLCAYCGEEPLLSSRCGKLCLEKRRKRDRKRLGQKPRRDGQRGRPALS